MSYTIWPKEWFPLAEVMCWESPTTRGTQLSISQPESGMPISANVLCYMMPTSCNEFGETPLFSAVSRGMTQVFLFLHHFYRDKDGCQEYGSYTTNDGDTILHSAIDEQHFDLAYIITGLYPDLVHQENNDGLSPQHLLATKPSAFPSGLYVSGISKLVYQCIPVRKLAQIPDLSCRPTSPQLKLSLSDRITHSILSMIMPKSHLTLIESISTEERQRRSDQQIDEEAADLKENLQRDVKKIFEEWSPVESMFDLLLRLSFATVCYAFRQLRFPYKWAKYILGYEEYVRLKLLKQRCIWSVEVMNELIPYNSKYAYKQGGMQAGPSNEEDKHMMETPILIAARHGMSEMVLRILDVSPWAKHDVNAEKKNIVMLAVENRHPHLYENLMTNLNFKKTIFGQVDAEGNSLLHLAANFKVGQHFQHLRGAAFHMQMEIKWYKFIKKSMSPRFFAPYNNGRQTPKEIFQESHLDLIKEGREWLTDTSQSCSLVAALIATVAFATSATVPGGLKQDNGVPSLEHKPIFIISASSSLVALSSSMISVVMFLGILTSNFKLKDFRKDLPYKLLLGLMSLLISIVSMFISFYAGHYFVLKQEFNHVAIIVYALMCFPLLVFIIAKFPLGFDMVGTTLRTKPRN